MMHETYKANNVDEITWLRLNRFKSIKLCENLIRKKLSSSNKYLSDEIVKSKAIGLSSAVDSAIGYWQTNSTSLNSKILSRYYFLLQMTIAEQVGSIKNNDDLKTVQKHTENGHGLATIINSNLDFPQNYFTGVLRGGHFYSYAKFLGIDIKNNSFERRPRDYSQVNDEGLLVNIVDLFRRIPELSNVIEEYVKKPPLSFNVGYSNMNDKIKFDLLEGKVQIDRGNDFKETFITFNSESELITVEYLKELGLPFIDINSYEDPFSTEKNIGAKLVHPENVMWHQHINLYRSAYSPTSYVVPLWDKINDNIVINLMLLYTLSIIVRYLPDIWYRINTGDLNHLGSLIEYYISIFDHIVPLQMLERISESNISIHQPGSLFGPL